MPENLRLKKNKGKQRKTVFLFSAFLLFISIISYAEAQISKMTVSDKSKTLDSEMEEINAEIEKKINDNEVFLMKDEIKNIKDLLDGHHYFSKAFNVIQKIIIEDVYLEDSRLLLDEDGNLIMEINGVANNYLSVTNQIAVFKNSYWIDRVEVNDISAEGENVSFSGKLEFKKEVVLFHKYYWDFGLTLLSTKTNRYLKINEYSATLKEVDGSEDFVEIEFSGVAYDKEKLILLEDDLKQMDVFVKDASVLYDLRKKSDSGVIDFSGKIELNMP